MPLELALLSTAFKVTFHSFGQSIWTYSMGEAGSQYEYCNTTTMYAHLFVCQLLHLYPVWPPTMVSTATITEWEEEKITFASADSIVGISKKKTIRKLKHMTE